jgi:hypothetical protein
MTEGERERGPHRSLENLPRPFDPHPANNSPSTDTSLCLSLSSYCISLSIIIRGGHTQLLLMSEIAIPQLDYRNCVASKKKSCSANVYLHIYIRNRIFFSSPQLFKEFLLTAYRSGFDSVEANNSDPKRSEVRSD